MCRIVYRFPIVYLDYHYRGYCFRGYYYRGYCYRGHCCCGIGRGDGLHFYKRGHCIQLSSRKKSISSPMHYIRLFH